MDGLIALIIVCLIVVIALFGFKRAFYWITKLIFKGEKIDKIIR